MIYPVLIHKEARSDYGVTVPDLPGCITAGRTIDEALAVAKEAIELHLEGLIEEGQMIPKPGAVQNHQRNRGYKNATWAVVAVDAGRLRASARRVNITIPERILDAFDRAAAAEHDTRSGLFTRAASAYLGKGARSPKSGAAGRWKP